MWPARFVALVVAQLRDDLAIGNRWMPVDALGLQDAVDVEVERKLLVGCQPAYGRPNTDLVGHRGARALKQQRTGESRVEVARRERRAGGDAGPT